MNEKCFVLFIYELSLLKDVEYLYTNKDYQIVYYFDERLLDPGFINQLNHFIEKIYNENKELLSVIFNMELLDKFIENRYQILELKPLTQMISKYRGIDKYLELVESVGPEKDTKINELALKFINYYNQLLELYEQKPNGICKLLTQ